MCGWLVIKQDAMVTEKNIVPPWQTVRSFSPQWSQSLLVILCLIRSICDTSIQLTHIYLSGGLWKQEYYTFAIPLHALQLSYYMIFRYMILRCLPAIITQGTILSITQPYTSPWTFLQPESWALHLGLWLDLVHQAWARQMYSVHGEISFPYANSSSSWIPFLSQE